MHRTSARCRTVAVHRRWYWTLWVSTTLAVETPTDLFVASHWLERSSSRFSVTLLVFSQADHSISQVLTNFYVVFISTYSWRLASKSPMLIRPNADWSTTMMSHATVNSDARSIRSLLKIFEYANKQACKQLQCNKAKLSEAASINGLHNIRVYARASL